MHVRGIYPSHGCGSVLASTCIIDVGNPVSYARAMAILGSRSIKDALCPALMARDRVFSLQHPITVF